MRSTKFFVNVVAFLFLAVGTSASVRAQGSKKCSASVEYLALSKVVGNDLPIGYVFSNHQEVQRRTGAERLDYGVDLITPVGIRPKVGNTFLFTAGCHLGGGRGIRLQGWNANTQGSVAGQVTSPAQFDNSSTIVGFQQFGSLIPPVTNENDPSGFSPVKYHAADSTSFSKYDVLFEGELIRSQNFQLGMLAGVSFGRIRNLRREGQTQHAYIKFEMDSMTFEDGFFFDRMSDKFNNDISLTLSSGARTSLVGPTFGLTGTHRFGRLEVGWQGIMTLFVGNAKFDGAWIDTDSIQEVIAVGTSTVVIDSMATLLKGVIPTVGEESMVVPALELHATVGVRVTNHITVGGGLFLSSLFGVSTAPSLDFPGQWTDMAGTTYRRNERSPMLMGASTFIRFSF